MERYGKGQVNEQGVKVGCATWVTVGCSCATIHSRNLAKLKVEIQDWAEPYCPVCLSHFPLTMKTTRRKHHLKMNLK
jgi:hypothetical protein